MSCNQMSAEYLFMTDKLYDLSYDTGDKVIQCGRHNDIFKLWLQWRAKGTEGFADHMDHLMDLAQYQVKKIKQNPDKFYLIMEPECVNVSFWYIPKRLREGTCTVNQMPLEHLRKHKMINGQNSKCGRISPQICPIIKARMMQTGTMMVGYQPDDRRPNFFRSIISSAAVTEKDVDFMLEEFDRLGHDL
uniref:Glutamate decarboxylase n=1 Tax=Phlebotomus papatasi TaxID=29031 RepID=A0A1B0DFY0_PHLPP